MSEKELWPGSGFYFDLKSIKESDFDLIEQEAEKLPDPQAKIRFYERAKTELGQAPAGQEARTVWERCDRAISLQKRIFELQTYEMAGMETWSGAGIYFDWHRLRDDDCARVEEHLRKMPDEKTRLKWLTRFFIEYDCTFPLIGKGESESIKKSKITRAKELWHRCYRLQDRARRIAQMEGGASVSAARPNIIEAPDSDSETMDEQPESNKLSMAQSVWAVHYLLAHAGINIAGVNKTDIARFISALTGWNYAGVYQRVREKRQGTPEGTRADLDAIRPFFEKLGLLEIVAKIDRGEE